MGHEVTRLIQRVLLSAALLAAAFAAPALGDDPPVELPPEPPPFFDLVFPVVGDQFFTDTFGHCRGANCERSHDGIDIMSADGSKGQAVVAAADGVVVEVRGLDADGVPVPGGAQWLIIDHGGWFTWYLHLNNDTPGTNDGLGMGIAPDIVAAHVEAGSEVAHPVAGGQLIGWLGDSGNAEGGWPHLHFEVRVGETKWDAIAINPHEMLLVAADPPDAPAIQSWRGHFSDDDDSVHEPDIDRLADAGIAKGCNPPLNTMFCPERLITRGEIAAFIRRTLALPTSEIDHFTDDSNSVFEGDINALADAGIALECEPGRYCPDRPLLRNEMAEMLVRAFADDHPERYANPDGEDYFVDVDGDAYEESINRLMAAGVTKGCNPPDNDRFCPDRPLIRAEMASFFWRALEG